MYFRIQLKEKQQLKTGKKTITVYLSQLPKNHQKFCRSAVQDNWRSAILKYKSLLIYM